jgi:hypothetical protein
MFSTQISYTLWSGAIIMVDIYVTDRAIKFRGDTSKYDAI